MRTWFDDAGLTRQFRGSLERLFSDFLEGIPHLDLNSTRAPQAFPPLNCWEDEGCLYAECEIPGVNMDDLELQVVGKDLTLKGHGKAHAAEGATYHRQERDVGTFHRVVQLPVEIDSEKVSADFRDGVLTIKLPKAPEAKARKIDVKCLST